MIQSELKKVFKLSNTELEEQIQKFKEIDRKIELVDSENQEITGKISCLNTNCILYAKLKSIIIRTKFLIDIVQFRY